MSKKTILTLFLVLIIFLGTVGYAASQTIPDKNDHVNVTPKTIEQDIAHKFSYQGMLRENDMPVNGTRNMDFLFFYNDACLGAEEYGYSVSDVSVQDGLFSVDIDAPPPYVLDGTAMWLQAVVGGISLGCEEILPVPYALSLVPGANISADNEQMAVGFNNQDIGGDGIRTFAHAVYDDYAALYAVNDGTGTAVYGYSTEGYGGNFSTSSSTQYALKANGSHGLTVSTWSGTGILVDANGGEGNDVFAIRSEGHEDDGVFGWSHGTDNTDNGIAARGEVGYGIYAFSVTDGQYGGYFPDPIFVNGGCTGCVMSYVGHNSSNQQLQKGEVVRAIGVNSDIQGATPVVNVEPATADKPILGVVVGRVEVTKSAGDDSHEAGDYFGPVGGTAVAGDYLIYAVSGPVEMQVASNAQFQPGDRIYLHSNGVSRTVSDTPLGLALDIPNADGLAWVMLDLQ